MVCNQTSSSLAVPHCTCGAQPRRKKSAQKAIRLRSRSDPQLKRLLTRSQAPLIITPWGCQSGSVGDTKHTQARDLFGL
jgi:hypothetical protein